MPSVGASPGSQCEYENPREKEVIANGRFIIEHHVTSSCRSSFSTVYLESYCDFDDLEFPSALS